MILDDSWNNYMHKSPPAGKLCEFARESWDTPLVARKEDLHPESNVYGLYWRLTGIGKKEASE